MGKIIDMATRGEIVAFLPTKTVSKGEILKELNDSISRAERLLKLLEAAPSLPPEGRSAFEAFMQRLEPTLRECRDRIEIVPNVSWVKIHGLATGHKVYISKGKMSVNRVDSTLPPELVPGAVTPTNRNGRIASWLPADVESVAFAVRLIAADDIELKR